MTAGRERKLNQRRQLVQDTEMQLLLQQPAIGETTAAYIETT